MKIRNQVLAATAFTFSSLMLGQAILPTPARAASYADTTIQARVARHLALAAKYEKLAEAQQALIDEHVQMKVDNHKVILNQKSPAALQRRVDAMDRHCDSIIKLAQQEKATLLEFARWEKDLAAETPNDVE